jgi:hypothetical protein
MAYSFNPITGKLDDIGTGSTGASTSTANTWSDNQTFSGTANTAPSQTAASGSSLMTRDLVGYEALFQNGEVFLAHPLPAVGQAGLGAGSAASAGDRYANVISGSAVNGYGRASIYRCLTTVPSITGTAIDFSKKMGVSLRCMSTLAIGSDPNSRARIIFGGNGGVPATADANALTTRGFGLEMGNPTSTGHSGRLFAHNGTTYTTGAWFPLWSGNPAGVYPLTFILTSDGAGTITLYYSLAWAGSRSNLSTTSISGGPTVMTGSLAWLDIVAVNPSTGTPVSMTFSVPSIPVLFVK